MIVIIGLCDADRFPRKRHVTNREVYSGAALLYRKCSPSRVSIVGGRRKLDDRVL